MKTKFPGLLDEKQIAAIVRAQPFLEKLSRSIADMHTVLIVDHGMPLRPMNVTQAEIGRFLHDLEGLLFNHDLAMAKWRAEVGAKPERLAA